MPTYGIEMRAKPILTVLRGAQGLNSPSTLTKGLPVNADAVATLKSGMVVSAAINGSTSQEEWVIGWTAGTIPYLALQDGDHFDVVSANSLVGYSCLGDFVLQTGYFKSADSYPIDTPVTLDGTTGSIKAGADANDLPIIGYITESAHDLLDGGATGYPSVSGVTSGSVVAFQTAWVTAGANHS